MERKTMANLWNWGEGQSGAWEERTIAETCMLDMIVRLAPVVP